MKKRILQFRMTAGVVMIVLLFGVAGKMCAYDFSAVCETGQTLYYNITDVSNHYVELTYHEFGNYNNYNNNWNYWGDIVLSESVQYEGVNYTVISVGEYAFYNCYELTGSLTIPNSVTSIGDYAFYNCSGFTGSLTIGSSVTSIGNSAFYNCSGLTDNLFIPSSVTSIGDYAFSICSGLTGSLIIGNSVTSIGNSAFSDCSGLTGDLVIPNSVTTIGSGAFTYCYNITGELVLSNSVTTIGAGAFEYCSFTGNLIIPNSVTEFGEGVFAFAGFDGELVLSDSMTNIPVNAFQGCGFTGELTIPNTITWIQGGAFSGAGFSGALSLPNSITHIGHDAFSFCGFTGCLEIPNSVIEIGARAFCWCDGISCITIPNTVGLIGGEAFQNTGWYNNQPDGMLYLDGWCLGYKEIQPVGTLTFQENTIGIAGEAFFNCTELTGVLTIPESIRSIGDFAFYGCTGLTELHFNAMQFNYMSGNYPFMECAGLTTLVIGNSVESIPDYIFSDVGFTGNLIIPNSVTSIGKGAFQGCNGFSGELVIPNSVSSIGELAFYRCSGFSGKLTIPHSVSLIGGGAFENCIGLSSVILPNTLTSIKNETFYGCSGLTSIIIPSSITSIETSAFRNCSGLTSIIMLPIIVPTVGYNPFYGTSTDLTIYVPYESLSAYQTTSYWSNFSGQMRPMSYKSISGYGEGDGNWQFIASPLTESTAPTEIDEMLPAADTYDLYRFDQIENAEWQNYKANNFNFANGQGYLYANAEDVNIIFKGTFNEDDTKEVSLAYDANANLAGWNLVGNPFPVSAYANRSYYVMNEEGTAIEPVAVSMETAIPSCTGVMVKAENTGETVTFSKTALREGANQGVLQIAVAQADTRGAAMMDKAIVSFNAGDKLEKFVFNKDNAQLYIPRGKCNYAVVSAEKTGEMPLNFEVKKKGTYTLTVDTELADMEYLHLIDNLTGNDVDLLTQPTYTFEAKTTDYASRFKLVFSVSGDADGDDDSFAFFNGNAWTIANEGSTTLKVVDMLGHVISSETINGNATFSTDGFSAGVYMMRLMNGEKVKVQKVVVR